MYSVFASKERSAKRKKNFHQFLLNFVIILSLIIMLFPLAMTLWNSFKSLKDYQSNMWFPSLPIRFFNYKEAYVKLAVYLKNTLIVAALGVTGMLIISSLASYAIGKIKFPGSKICFAIVLGLMMLPGVLTLVPSSLIYKSLKLDNTYFALVFPIWTNGCLMSVFLFVTFFKGLPNEIFEAAKIDGANEFKQYFTIAVPLSLPTIGTAAIIQLVSIWNDYLWPQTIQSSDEMYTIPAGILFRYSNYENYPEMYASYMIAALPLLILFIFANKYYIKGLVGSAIKM